MYTRNLNDPGAAAIGDVPAGVVKLKLCALIAKTAACCGRSGPATFAT